MEKVGGKGPVWQNKEKTPEQVREMNQKAVDSMAKINRAKWLEGIDPALIQEIRAKAKEVLAMITREDIKKEADDNIEATIREQGPKGMMAVLGVLSDMEDVEDNPLPYAKIATAFLALTNEG